MNPGPFPQICPTHEASKFLRLTQIDLVIANQLPKRIDDVSHPSKGYFPPSAYHFHNLKQRVLFNAHAYNVQSSSKAEYFDLIISTTSTGHLNGVECPDALVVYYNPKLHDWKMLYRSKSCPTAEDALFEAKYRLKVMSTIEDKMDEGNTWAPEETSEQKPLTEASTKKEKGDDSPNKATGDCDGTGKADKNKGKVVPRQPTTLADRTKAEAATIMLDLKRKSAAEDDVDRMKSTKIDDKERTLSARRR
ncbi:unnamed protein product [Alternaria alternata]